jgi:tetratricopeptide (TPR) repeat protein
VASEARFRHALDQASPDQRLELLTQIARTYSLRRRFAEAHAELDAVEPFLVHAGLRPRLRYLLERGRTFNSAGNVEQARTLFTTAWEVATEVQEVGIQEEGLAVDAAHMVAITYAGTNEAFAWHQKGVALARQSKDAKAQALLPALLNNMAWDLHEQGNFAEALLYFQEAQTAWETQAKVPQIQIAQWSVARCLRSLARHPEALAILYALAKQHDQQGSTDGYVYEEIGENLEALGQYVDAKPYFRLAADTLAQDPWFVQHEATRLERLRQRAAA